MRLLMAILGAVVGLFTTLFLADCGVKAARKYRRNYITLSHGAQDHPL